MDTRTDARRIIGGSGEFRNGRTNPVCDCNPRTYTDRHGSVVEHADTCAAHPEGDVGAHADSIRDRRARAIAAARPYADCNIDTCAITVPH